MSSSPVKSGSVMAGGQAEQSPECAEHGIAGCFTLWRDTARRRRDDGRTLLLEQFLGGRPQGPALGNGRKIVGGRDLAALLDQIAKLLADLVAALISELAQIVRHLGRHDRAVRSPGGRIVRRQIIVETGLA